MVQSKTAAFKSGDKRYKIGLTCRNELVLWVGDHFEKSSRNIYQTPTQGGALYFEPIAKEDLIDGEYMAQLTCTGAKLLRSKTVNGKVVSRGSDLADDWIEQNGGKFVEFDSSKFMIQRNRAEDCVRKSMLLYVGEDDAHVDIPEGVRHIDRIFMDSGVSSVSVPDSVETAFDVFGQCDKFRADVIKELKNGLFYAMDRKGEHTAGWVLPDDCSILGYTDHTRSYSDRIDKYPVIWYERDSLIYEYDPHCDPKVMEADRTVESMAYYANWCGGVKLTAHGVCLICGTDLSNIPESKPLSEFVDFVCINADHMKDSETGKKLYEFDNIEDADFGDLALYIKQKGDSHGYDVKWSAIGYNSDGTNLHGKPFNISEGVVTTDKLFYRDDILKNGVGLAASVISAESMYEGSLVEEIPSFPAGSRLENADRFCLDCRNCGVIPLLPDTVKSSEDAFAGTPWDGDLPISNAQGMNPDEFEGDTFDFDDIEFSLSPSMN